MSVAIQNIEHLPNEETILIHYIIGTTGLWDLAQMNTAYRGVCESGWTIMYPNTQHPRHTDLPISVAVGAAQATFAWNYGGIQGIAPANFISNHSYLTQLTLYELNGCNPTVTSPVIVPTGWQGGAPSGEIKKLTPSLGGRSGTNPKGGELIPGGGGPGHPGPGVPGIGDPTGTGQTTEEGTGPGGTIEEAFIPVRSHNYIRSAPDDDRILLRTTTEGGRESRAERFEGAEEREGAIVEKFSYIPKIQLRPQAEISKRTALPSIFSEAAEIAEPGQLPGLPFPSETAKWPYINLDGWSIGIDDEDSASIANIIFDETPLLEVSEGVTLERSEQGLGQTIDHDVDFRVRKGPGMYYRLSVPPWLKSDDPNYKIDRTVNLSDSEGVVGRAGTQVIATNHPIATTLSLGRVNRGSLVGGAETIIRVPREQIPVGDRMVVNGIFKPPEGTELIAHGEIYIIDRDSTYLVGVVTRGTVSNPSPMCFSGLLRTDWLGAGQAVIVFLAKDGDNKVIGVDSTGVHIASPDSIDFAGTSAEKVHGHVQTPYDDVPPSLRNILSVTSTPIPVWLRSGGQLSLILVKDDDEPREFSALFLAEGSYEGAIEAKISLFNTPDTAPVGHWVTVEDKVEGEQGGVDLPTVMGAFAGVALVRATPIVTSSSRLHIDGQPFLPHSHVTALEKFETDQDTLTMYLAPVGRMTSELVQGKLYMHKSYKIREATMTVGAIDGDKITVTGTCPYPDTVIRIYVNGVSKNNIPSVIPLQESATDYDGAFEFTIVAGEGEFVTLVAQGNGSYNYMTDAFATFELVAEHQTATFSKPTFG